MKGSLTLFAENQFDLLWYRDEVWLVVIDG